MLVTTTMDEAGSVDLDAVRQLNHPVVVTVARDARGWQAEVVALGVVRRARCLHALDRLVRDLLGTDTVDYQFQTGDAELDRLVRQIRLAREVAQRHEERVRKLTSRVIALPSGGSGRDMAVLLGVSHQWVHRLLSRYGRPPADGDAR